MYYTSFRIRNFKGIKDTTIILSRQSKAGVFAFVGLNESGKTTILEAIHSFKPDRATSELVGEKEKSSVPFEERIPRHQLSNFTGNISVTATVKFERNDKQKIINELQKQHEIIFDPSTLDDEVAFERQQKFERGKFLGDDFFIISNFQVKTVRQKSYRKPEDEKQAIIRDLIYSHAPDIAYFPTFVFDFPKQIFLTEERGSKVSKFYRDVFQDILDYDGEGETIQESIINRVRGEGRIGPFLNFFAAWTRTLDERQVKHITKRAGEAVTKVVFGRWNEIFGENVSEKRITISHEVLQGERKDESGATYQTDEHDFCIEFEIEDGTRMFEIKDRSLGFRWFFAFMLFTQFRVARKESGPILFLFDEPASNLHAATQEKLIAGFPDIAKDSHMLAYTTHSHYMIDPKWLEQTFIVTNRSDAPSDSIVDDALLSDESLDIKATPYKTFANLHPNQTNYFQPILDRLQVVPSHFDTRRNSVALEGKSDYYVIRYVAEFLKKKNPHLIPVFGAGTFDSLISLSLGWNLNMLFLLDGDAEGRKERKRYIKEYILDKNRVITISELVDGVKEIEDLFDAEARKKISDRLELGSQKLNKKHISRFCQESLASGKIISLGKGFKDKAKKLLDELEKRIPKHEES